MDSRFFPKYNTLSNHEIWTLANSQLNFLYEYDSLQVGMGYRTANKVKNLCLSILGVNEHN